MDDVLFYVKAEVERAKNKHPGDFHSAHEGYAVLLEEVDELKAEVWKSKHDKAAMRTEAIHVAAMAVRFVTELCAVEEAAAAPLGQHPAEHPASPYESAQNCGCDMGCKPRPHYCERHAHLELC